MPNWSLLMAFLYGQWKKSGTGEDNSSHLLHFPEWEVMKGKAREKH